MKFVNICVNVIYEYYNIFVKNSNGATNCQIKSSGLTLVYLYGIVYFVVRIITKIRRGINMNKATNINGNRLALLRKSRGLSQDEFAKKFSEFAPRYDKDGNIKPPMKTMTISNWETGRKVPPSETLLQLASFYGVSFDYICGLSNSETPNAITSKEDLYSASTPIKFNDLYKYDEKPIFMKFNNPELKDQWGIVNTNNEYVLCELGRVHFSNKIEYYISTPLNNLTIHTNGSKYLLNINDIMKKDIVYCEPIGMDERIAPIVRGFYTHSSDKTCLINKQNGYALPYEAVGQTYNAFEHR